MPPAAFAQTYAIVCAHALESGTLRASDEPIFHRLQTHAEEHAAALEAALERAGITPPKRPVQRSEVQLPGYTGARTRAHYLRFARITASGSIGASYAALQSLDDDALLRLVAAVMAADAQSLVALRRLEGDAALAFAFETGRPE